MCGRFVLTTPADALAAEFAALAGGLILLPRYNIGPMQSVVVVRETDGTRELAMLRWGLIPSWANDAAIAARLTNARSETAAQKPFFRDAMRSRRCIVPASGFYEWKREGKQRQPWYFHPSAASACLAIAAIWESWRSAEGETIESCCLLTTAANRLLEPVHDRMPVLLTPAGVKRWMDASCDNAEDLIDLLTPAAPEVLACHPVSTAVNSVRNDEASNVEEIVVAQGSFLL